VAALFLISSIISSIAGHTIKQAFGSVLLLLDWLQLQDSEKGNVCFIFFYPQSLRLVLSNSHDARTDLHCYHTALHCKPLEPP
jgi:hypothetical protein